MPTTYDSAKIALQNAEFDAAERFATAVRAHQNVAVVDDDYPRVRSDYEGALQALIRALDANGRLPAQKPVDNPARACSVVLAAVEAINGAGIEEVGHVMSIAGANRRNAFVHQLASLLASITSKVT